MKNDTGGYIALISTLVIALLLVAITFSLSFSAFSARFNILDSEKKGVSNSLAESCVNAAMVKLAANATYTPPPGGETLSVGNDTCTILDIQTSGSQKIIKSQGTFQNTYTNILATITLGTNSITLDSQEETPTP